MNEADEADAYIAEAIAEVESDEEYEKSTMEKVGASFLLLVVIHLLYHLSLMMH